MKTASHNLVAGRLESAAAGAFYHAIHLVQPGPRTVDAVHVQSLAHPRRQALTHALFTLARLVPAMLWLGGYGWKG